MSKRYYKLVLVLFTIYFTNCGEEPNIIFPGYNDPHGFTNTHYSFNSRIEALRKEAPEPGFSKDVTDFGDIEGIVLNSYDSKADP